LDRSGVWIDCEADYDQAMRLGGRTGDGLFGGDNRGRGDCGSGLRGNEGCVGI